VAYVFVHIFPELAAAQETLREGAGEGLAFLEHHAYLVAMAGMAVFYGLERLVRVSRHKRGTTPDAGAGETTTGLGVFWVHIASFAIYNALVGYLLLHREEQDLRGLLFFFLAMAFHFLVNDFGLRQDHKDTYRRLGRWTLAAGIVAGWLGGALIQVGRPAVALLFAFLAGGVILNVLKEELPEERQSRFWAFASGAVAYAGLLVLI
jgi:zinc transporter ZupT